MSEQDSAHPDDEELQPENAANEAADGSPELEANDFDAAFADAEPVEDLADTDAQLAEANSNLLRAQAEMENLHKRMTRQMQEERRFAAESMLKDLLPVLDNLERALTASADDSPLTQGVKMVAEQFVQVLDQNHCKRIEAKGQVFDPNLHEAIAQLPGEAPAGTVMEVVQVGYQLHERVLRPTQVVVSQGPPPSEDA